MNQHKRASMDWSSSNNLKIYVFISNKYEVRQTKHKISKNSSAVLALTLGKETQMENPCGKHVTYLDNSNYTCNRMPKKKTLKGLHILTFDAWMLAWWTLLPDSRFKESSAQKGQGKC